MRMLRQISPSLVALAVALSLPAAAEPPKPAPKAGKLSYHEQRELDQIQDKITAAEAQAAELDATVTALAASGDYKQLAAKSSEMQAATQTVEQLYSRWDELERKRSGAT